MRRNIVAEAVGLPLRLGRALVLGLSVRKFRLSASVQPGARFAWGAVVTDDVPPRSVVAGSPATAVRSARKPQS
jgi:carbonic anhydrase/acetyltransferase-like protein (isoleucine patch superfamily)